MHEVHWNYVIHVFKKNPKKPYLTKHPTTKKEKILSFLLIPLKCEWCSFNACPESARHLVLVH